MQVECYRLSTVLLRTKSNGMFAQRSPLRCLRAVAKRVLGYRVFRMCLKNVAEKTTHRARHQESVFLAWMNTENRGRQRTKCMEIDM